MASQGAANQDTSLLIQDELVLFYRVKDLQAYDFKKVILVNTPATETTAATVTQQASNSNNLATQISSEEPSTMNDESNKTAQESSTNIIVATPTTVM